MDLTARHTASVLAAALLSTGCGNDGGGLRSGSTLECGLASSKGSYFAVVGQVERYKGRQAAVVSLVEPADPWFEGVTAVAVDADALKRACRRSTTSRALAPGFQQGAGDWRANAAAGQAGLFMTSPDEFYEPTRGRPPPPGGYRPATPGEKRWWGGLACAPAKAGVDDGCL